MPLSPGSSVPTWPAGTCSSPPGVRGADPLGNSPSPGAKGSGGTKTAPCPPCEHSKRHSPRLPEGPEGGTQVCRCVGPPPPLSPSTPLWCPPLPSSQSNSQAGLCFQETWAKMTAHVPVSVLGPRTVGRGSLPPGCHGTFGTPSLPRPVTEPRDSSPTAVGVGGPELAGGPGGLCWDHSREPDVPKPPSRSRLPPSLPLSLWAASSLPGVWAQEPASSAAPAHRTKI